MALLVSFVTHHQVSKSCIQSYMGIRVDDDMAMLCPCCALHSIREELHDLDECHSIGCPADYVIPQFVPLFIQ